MKNLRSFSKKLLFSFAMIATLCTGIAGAKPAVFEKGPKEAIRTYIETNVLPVLRVQRQKLEETLSVEEKEQISALREQMQQLKDQRSEASGDATMHEKPTEEEREVRETRREEGRHLMAEAMPIARQHEAMINDLTAEIADQRKQWEIDIQSIIDELGERGADSPDTNHRPAHPDHDALRLDDPAHFLLLDPDATYSEESNQSRLYPNPVNEASVLEYQLAKKSPVIISLFNEEGIPVKTLVYEIQNPGSYQISMEANELAPGTYAYSFSTADKTETGRLVKL